MRLGRVPEAVEQLGALDGPTDAVAGAVSGALGTGVIKDALSGTWLGHALHPMLTDLPIGFWTSAWVLDIIGGESSDDAARTLVGLGVLSALPTAATGLSDWSDSDRAATRVGAVHAVANSVALACYTVSWAERRRGRRGAGIAWGWAGATAATIGGYLGGHLVNALGVGVDNTTFDVGPDQWTSAGPAQDLEGGAMVRPEGGPDVLVVADGERLDAIADRCTHRGAPLHEGAIAGGCVTCPWHGSRFRLGDGEIERGPAALPQPTYDARLVGAEVEVRTRA